jgi:hypothetical protein
MLFRKWKTILHFQARADSEVIKEKKTSWEIFGKQALDKQIKIMQKILTKEKFVHRMNKLTESLNMVTQNMFAKKGANLLEVTYCFTSENHSYWTTPSLKTNQKHDESGEGRKERQSQRAGG